MSCQHRNSDLRNLVNGLYNLGQTIGTGHFAVVKLGRHIFTQKEVAIKVIDKIKLDEISKVHLFQEVKCMKLVQHPNVVRLYEVIDTPTKLYLILEFADGGDMYDYITRHANGLNEILARKYFRQICRALKYCHEMYVCHRDLKPENIVFFEKQGVVKLTDFGFSNLFSPGKKLLTSCGSLAYSAPEILLGDPYDAPAVDIWSLGVILFMLVTGRAPFQEANDSETVMMIMDCSYKVPSHISAECQNLIYRMIVREPEKRATLDEVMSDIWYRQCEDDDTDEYSDNDTLKLISHEDHETILRQMMDGNIADQDTILKSLNDNQYNHITATYYLLAEKILHEKFNNEDRNVKRQRCSLQPTNDPFKEQTSVFISSTNNFNFNFADVSLPISRQDSIDEDFDVFSIKENFSPVLPSPRHSFDSANEPLLPGLVENEEERLSLQQRAMNINIPITPAQAMKIILEEDENPESPSTDIKDAAIQQLMNYPKLNKIIENEDEDDKPFDENTTVFIENSATASSILRSKDLRSVVEIKRRNFSHSCSSSDSEDNGSNHEVNRSTNPKHTRSPNSYQESESGTKHRGRSLSNIEHVLREIPSNVQQQTTTTNNSETMKRKTFSRTGSINSANRLILNNANDDVNADLTNSSTLINDRPRSLSTEHRLANPSQMSIASRTSVRHSTPRESIVFTKNEAPNFLRLLQQKQHPEMHDPILNTNEHYQLPSISDNKEDIQTPIIIEEDSSSPLISTSNGNISSPVIIDTNYDEKNCNTIVPILEYANKNTGNSPSSPRSVLVRLKYSILKQQRKSTTDCSTTIDTKQKRSVHNHRVCCTIS